MKACTSKSETERTHKKKKNNKSTLSIEKESKLLCQASQEKMKPTKGLLKKSKKQAINPQGKK